MRIFKNLSSCDMSSELIDENTMSNNKSNLDNSGKTTNNNSNNTNNSINRFVSNDLF